MKRIISIIVLSMIPALVWAACYTTTHYQNGARGDLRDMRDLLLRVELHHELLLITASDSA